MANSAMVQLLKQGSEDNIDTFGEYATAQAEIYKKYAEQIIVKNEEIIESDKKVQDNKKEQSAKDKELKEKQAKQDEEALKNYKTNLDKASSESKKFQELNKATKIRDILIGIPKTVRDAYGAGMAAGGVFAPIRAAAYAATAFAAQTAQLQQIKKAQYGADFITDKPQMLLVGEGSGPERVQVTPLVDDNKFGPQGANIVLNISGNVMSEQYTEDVIIPQIKEGLRLGGDIGIN